MGRHRVTFAAYLFASCCCVITQAQSALPDSPERRLEVPVLTRIAAGHLFDPLDVGIEPMSSPRPSPAPLSSMPLYDMRAKAGKTAYEASSFVAVDSWVYLVLERLIALGYVRTGSLAIRPLTRVECARLVAEAHTKAPDTDLVKDNSGVVSQLLALDREFAHESHLLDGDVNSGATFEGAYARYNAIAGNPLRDSFHFGQTVYNDFGRPYGQGSNVVAGASGHAEWRPFGIYARSEFQHGASSPAYSAAAQQTIENYDQTTEGWQLPAGAATPSVFNFNPDAATRFRLIEGYAAVNIANWQLSAGQQSLWWGPDRTTSLLLSNNAAAMPMIRLTRVKSARAPFVLKYIGQIHFDSFFSREGGIHYLALGRTFVLNGNQNSAMTPPPYIVGATVSAEPTKNLELTFAHTVVFAGYGRPLTVHTFLHTWSKYGNDQVLEPGKRVTAVSIASHFTLFGQPMVVYSEAMSWDNPFQGHFTQRFGLAPGIYLPKVPYVKKLDLRMEGVYTDLPGLKYLGYFYGNAHYVQGYTNYGQILGSWIGREGRGGEATSTYWFSPRSKATATYRKMVASPALLQGGNLTDVSGSFSWLLNPRVQLSTVQQYERWRFPVLDASPKSNFSLTFQVELLNRPKL